MLWGSSLMIEFSAFKALLDTTIGFRGFVTWRCGLLRHTERFHNTYARHNRARINAKSADF